MMDELRVKMSEVVTDEYLRFVKLFLVDVMRAIRRNERRMLVLCGSDSVKVAGVTVDVIRRYLRRVGGKIRVLHVYHDEFQDARDRATILRKFLGRKLKDMVAFDSVVYELSKKYLGTTLDVLIMDLTNDLKPNDVGRLLGIVKGGGLIILQVPPLNTWPKALTIFKTNLTVPNHPEPRHVFIEYFIRKIMEHNGIYVLDVDFGKVIKYNQVKEKGKHKKKELEIPKERIFPEELYKLALTQDQINVIKLIEDNLVPKPGGKHVALVITSDRGRGKSSAVGIGVVGLIRELAKHKNKVRVAVTAVEPLSIQSLMMLAKKALEALGVKYKEVVKEGNVIELKGENFSIEYWEPYTVLKLNVDVVVVDEAAGLPVPLLHMIWKNFRRTVYATTIHGYEGAGRGFSVRFLKRLKEDKKTKLVIYEMNEPIRYSSTDPIEKFQFDALLLDAEPEPLTDEDFEEIRKGEFEYVAYEPSYLFSKEGEETLKRLFGIYVLAHYRNEPDDLGRLADAPHHSIRAVKLKKSGKIVGAAQLAEEGGLQEELIDELLAGGKIPGNIIPDRLLKHFRVRDLGKGLGWRIVRIATHIDAQGLGIGSYLLSKIVEEATTRGYAWVGAGFGVSKELLKFWLKNGFKILHLSPDRNPVSGEYSALVVKPLNNEWEKLINLCVKEFALKLVESLYSVYKDLESDVVYLILTSGVTNVEFSESLKLSRIQLERLNLYVLGLMTYESVADAVNLYLKKVAYEGSLTKLSEFEGFIAIAKALQGLTWEEITRYLNISSVKATSTLRKAVEKLLGMPTSDKSVQRIVNDAT
ncbi:MAG: hypothetical protein B7O98_06045 [Zestosphaera tikiterensis]|uniref:tRNA(Met) cytidine acetyltransferase TmcA n=1 Tax=Zestosphaera tikiterensis TaxID=1973259 RepID=A0A2R7Y3Y8_9CREN|nr:MAG: hypothetical protein B7O98_06045 [Zestosphaera tikiterensis]